MSDHPEDLNTREDIPEDIMPDPESSPPADTLSSTSRTDVGRSNDSSDDDDGIDKDENHPIQDFIQEVRNQIGITLFSFGFAKNRFAYEGMEQELQKSGVRTRKKEMYISLAVTLIFMLLLAIIVGFVARSPGYLADRAYNMDPFSCIHTTLTTTAFIPYALLALLAAVITIFQAYRTTESKDDRRLEISDNDTHGSDRFMGEKEIRDTLRVEPIETNDGPMYGKLKTGEVVARHQEYREGKKNFNNSTVVFGASGGRKTRGYLINNIYQSIRRGENCFINDPKMEIYALTSQQFKDAGYEVHLFATKPDFMPVSDSWNPLDGIHGDFVKASIVANRIIFRSKDIKREFWLSAALSLLTGLIQYVTYTDEYAKSGTNTLNEIARLITREQETVSSLANTLSADHPAVHQLIMFQNAGDVIKGSVLYNLGLILGLFTGNVKNLVSHSDFNLTDAAGSERHVYFIGTDDQDDTFYFMNSIFINFAYADLVARIDTLPSRKGERPITFYLEEANQLGEIKDLDKKVSAVRSRGISTTLVFQDINMMHNLYGIDMTRTVLNNCASWVVIGSNDMTTNEFMSKRAGTMTVIQRQEGYEELTIGESLNYHPTQKVQYRESKRETLTLGEMFRGEGVLVFLAKCFPIHLDIFDMTEHPMYSETEDSAALRRKDVAPQESTAHTPSETPEESPEDRPHANSVFYDQITSPSSASEAPSSPPPDSRNSKPKATTPGKAAESRPSRVNIPPTPPAENLTMQDLGFVPTEAPLFDPKKDPAEFDPMTHSYYTSKRVALPSGKHPEPYFQDGTTWVYIDNKKWTKETPLVLQRPPKPPIYVEETRKWYYQETLRDPTPVPLQHQPGQPGENDRARLIAEARYKETVKPQRPPRVPLEYKERGASEADNA